VYVKYVTTYVVVVRCEPENSTIKFKITGMLVTHMLLIVDLCLVILMGMHQTLMASSVIDRKVWVANKVDSDFLLLRVRPLWQNQLCEADEQSARSACHAFRSATVTYNWVNYIEVMHTLSDEVLAWLSVWSEVQMICIWSRWCHCHPIISCFIKIQIGLPFWCRLTQVVLEKRPLNRCLSNC